MTKAEFKKKWAPKVNSSRGIHIVAGWEEDLNSMIITEQRHLREALAAAVGLSTQVSGNTTRINKDYPGTKEG